MNNLLPLLHMHGWTLLLVHLGRKKAQEPKIQSSSMRNSVLTINKMLKKYTIFQCIHIHNTVQKIGVGTIFFNVFLMSLMLTKTLFI